MSPVPAKTAIPAPDETRSAVEPTVMTEDEFVPVIRPYLVNLLRAAQFLVAYRQEIRLNRNLLGHILADTSRLEELMDAYGARNNSRWFIYRELIAAAKTFGQVAYIVLHIEHSTTRYRLLPVKGNFVHSTSETLEYLRDVMICVMDRMLDQTAILGLRHPRKPPGRREYREKLPGTILPADRARRHVGGAQQEVVHLASQFLDLASESAFLNVPDEKPVAEQAAFIPDPISEEALRRLEHKFHNFQSLYDTWLADTDLELADPELPTLRGHITVVFHLLQVGTLLCHFYERHLLLSGVDLAHDFDCFVDRERLLNTLMNYPILYASRYLEPAGSLCRAVLKRYAEISTIEVDVPPYRGFHVRPSTLISKIVLHYGSDVTMHLNQETYDAGSPLELFRANEEINAEKRRRLADLIGTLKIGERQAHDQDFQQLIRRAVLTLAEKGEIVIYQQPLPLTAEEPHPQQNHEEFLTEEVKRLLMRGKIDLESHLKVRFKGDRRVLHDIQLLAEHGYGEDRYGNNIPLPPQLAYLRRG